MAKIKWSFVMINGASRMSYKLGRTIHNDPMSPIQGLILFKTVLNCMAKGGLSSILMTFLSYLGKQMYY